MSSSNVISIYNCSLSNECLGLAYALNEEQGPHY